MNEYILSRYKDDKQIGDSEYYHKRSDAIKEAKLYLSQDPTIDECDLQVIYDYNDSDSELADVWWSITREGITKH